MIPQQVLANSPKEFKEYRIGISNVSIIEEGTLTNKIIILMDNVNKMKKVIKETKI